VGFDYTPLGADAKKDPAEPSLEVNTLRFDFYITARARIYTITKFNMNVKLMVDW
jgi:hypothetical protein